MLKKYTKNIHLYPINNKFNRNIIEMGSFEDILISNISMTNSIYKYYYGNQLLVNNTENLKHTFIINSSILNQEIVSFISSAANSIDFWILVDNSFKIGELNISNIRYILIDSVSKNTDNIKYLRNNTVNKKLYSELDISKKQDQIAYFFNNTKQIQNHEHSKLKEYLYPNTNLKIKLFDNQQFKHPQNLGYLSETDKRNILLQSKYYLFSDPDFYTTEALLCDCKLLDLNDQDIRDQMLKDNTIDKNSIEINYYDDFIKELCNE